MAHASQWRRQRAATQPVASQYAAAAAYSLSRQSRVLYQLSVVMGGAVIAVIYCHSFVELTG